MSARARGDSPVLAAEAREVTLELGWGRLVFGQTFTDPEHLANVLRGEASGRRDICMYLSAPHVLVALHPQEYFIDPSFTYRIDLTSYAPRRRHDSGVRVRPIGSREDCEAVNRIYVRCHMVPADVDTMWHNHLGNPSITYLVAVDDHGEVIGTVTGVDHVGVFGDPENGTSLWCLAVDPATPVPGVGELLVQELLARFVALGRARLDLSVMYDNVPAIRLYEAMGFTRTALLGVKRKTAINEHLFTGVRSKDDLDHLNPYARIVADEAIRRGIRVRVLDADTGYLELAHGGRTVITRESLSQYTSAVAMSRCEDKRITRKVVADAGIRVPGGRTATFDERDHEFLDEVGVVVVKPARGEQGAGITVRVTDHDELDRAIDRAGGSGTEILIEEHCDGEDLRIIVIDGAVIAAAVRRPARVVGTGVHTVRQLIEAQSRRRAAATGGESRIPLDEATEATVREEGRSFEEVLPSGQELLVRRTANLHTGGTIHDVTDELHPALAEAAVTAAEAIGIPVTGIDLLAADVSGQEYVFIEANERPGLANHEPRPTAAAFIDYLFPQTQPTPWAWRPDGARIDTSGSGDNVGG